MKKKQKGKLVLGLFMGCCLLYAMSGFSTKSVQAAASLQKEDGQLVGGKAQDISGGKIQTKRERRCKKYRSKESGYKEYRSREHRSKGSGRTKKYRNE